MSSQRLTQTQKMLQKLSPQQILLMKLLQIPTMELSSRIKEEIEENPALEEKENEVVEDEIHNDEDNDFADSILFLTKLIASLLLLLFFCLAKSLSIST